MPRIRTVKPEEAAEFRGLFFGEGHIDLCRSARGASLTPRLRIAVRDDDAALVEWCRDLFGGNLSRSTRTRSVCWQLTGRDAVQVAICALQGGTLPSKKRAEVRLLNEALALVPARGSHITPAASERLRAIREELKSLRAYTPATAEEVS